MPFADHLEWARTIRSPVDPEAPVMLAVEFVADALSETRAKESLQEAISLYEKLADEIDPMRDNYWHFKRRSAEATLAA